MTKDNKIIKDLKERNRKLSRQYRERDIRCFTLERQIEEMKEENQKYKETIDKAIDKLYCYGEILNADFQKDMLDILKEVK